MSGETTSVHLFVRSLSPSGARDRPSTIVDRLEKLVDEGHVSEYHVSVWGNEVDLATSATVDGDSRAILEQVAAFRSWTDERRVTLEGFQQREVTTLTGETHSVLTLPVMVLAEYTNGELSQVAPYSDDDRIRTVDDRLAALASSTEYDSHGETLSASTL